MTSKCLLYVETNLIYPIHVLTDEFSIDNDIGTEDLTERIVEYI